MLRKKNNIFLLHKNVLGTKLNANKEKIGNKIDKHQIILINNKN